MCTIVEQLHLPRYFYIKSTLPVPPTQNLPTCPFKSTSSQEWMSNEVYVQSRSADGVMQYGTMYKDKLWSISTEEMCTHFFRCVCMAHTGIQCWLIVNICLNLYTKYLSFVPFFLPGATKVSSSPKQTDQVLKTSKKIKNQIRVVKNCPQGAVVQAVIFLAGFSNKS